MKLLQDLLASLSIKQLVGPTDIPISILCFDSRQSSARSCFVAIAGTNVNGHDYIPEAIAAGSYAIVCESLPNLVCAHVTYIVVASSSQALGIMAANFYDDPSKKIKLIAVTGTNGKTTIVHLLYHMATKLGYKVGMLSTICNTILDKTYSASHTTADALQLHSLLNHMVERGCQYCFMEASSHAIVQNRLAGLHLMGAVFTNITHEHLDYHLDFENYIQAKKKLFDSLPYTSFAIVNQQDKNSSIMLQNCKAKKISFSLAGSADFTAKVITNSFHGLELEIEKQSIWFQLIGGFNASNLLAAYSVSHLLEWPSQESLVALSSIPPILGRMNRVSHGKGPQIMIDYAHTPDALMQVVTMLRAMRTSNSKLVTVMGCGGNRDQQKRAIIGKILAQHSDIAIFTSDNPREEDPQEIIYAMQEGVPVAARSKVLHIVDRWMAIKIACLLAGPSDMVLISGKGHQHYEEIKGIQHDFCEAQIVQDILSDITHSVMK